MPEKLLNRKRSRMNTEAHLLTGHSRSAQTVYCILLTHGPKRCARISIQVARPCLRCLSPYMRVAPSRPISYVLSSHVYIAMKRKKIGVLAQPS